MKKKKKKKKIDPIISKRKKENERKKRNQCSFFCVFPIHPSLSKYSCCKKNQKNSTFFSFSVVFTVPIISILILPFSFFLPFSFHFRPFPSFLSSHLPFHSKTKKKPFPQNLSIFKRKTLKTHPKRDKKREKKERKKERENVALD